jgi:hypothetical protein
VKMFGRDRRERERCAIEPGIANVVRRHRSRVCFNSTEERIEEGKTSGNLGS